MISAELGRSLAEQYGTPLYAYDLDQIDRRAAELFEVLPPDAKLYYSMKANPLPDLATTLSQCCGAEVSSMGELDLALDAGFEPACLLYTGPGKTSAEIRRAIDAGVADFSAESWGDLGRIAEVAAHLGRRPRVLLRINPARAPRSALSMSGGSGQFGFDEAALLGEPQPWQGFTEVLDFVGVHLYLGTQMRDVAALEDAFRTAVDAAERVSSTLGLPPRVVDLGGGFPWPYARSGEGLDLTPLRQPLAELGRKLRRDRPVELWFESGRYLCASAGTLLASVLDLKASGSKRYVALDAGINVLGGMAGLGRVLAPSTTIVPLSSEAAPGEALAGAEVVGPLCTPLDVLAREAALPTLRPGDLVAIPNVGAYGLTASLVGFLSRPAPVEVVYRGMEVVAASQLNLNRRWIG